MSYISSDRERRLWLWTLAALVAMYSTLPLKKSFINMIDEQISGALFLIGFILVLITICTHGLKTKPTRAELIVVLGIAATYILVLVRMSIPAERSHIVEYGVVAIFIYEALTERANQGRRVPMPAVLAMLATSFLGVLDECLQAFIPSRVFDPRDILFNVLAACMAVVSSVVLRKIRKAR